MQPTSSPSLEPLQAHARRVGKSFADLNARIARLALFVGASLASEADIQRIVHRQVAFFQQHPSLMDGQHPHIPHDRQAMEWEELRGLLVLRCNMMAGMLDDLGLDLTEQIVKQAEEHLERVGFKRGADGFVLMTGSAP